MAEAEDPLKQPTRFMLVVGGREEYCRKIGHLLGREHIQFKKIWHSTSMPARQGDAGPYPVPDGLVAILMLPPANDAYGGFYKLANRVRFVAKERKVPLIEASKDWFVTWKLLTELGYIKQAFVSLDRVALTPGEYTYEQPAPPKPFATTAPEGAVFGTQLAEKLAAAMQPRPIQQPAPKSAQPPVQPLESPTSIPPQPPAIPAETDEPSEPRKRTREYTALQGSMHPSKFFKRMDKDQVAFRGEMILDIAQDLSRFPAKCRKHGFVTQQDIVERYNVEFPDDEPPRLKDMMYMLRLAGVALRDGKHMTTLIREHLSAHENFTMAPSRRPTHKPKESPAMAANPVVSTQPQPRPNATVAPTPQSLVTAPFEAIPPGKTGSAVRPVPVGEIHLPAESTTLVEHLRDMKTVLLSDMAALKRHGITQIAITIDASGKITISPNAPILGEIVKLEKYEVKI